MAITIINNQPVRFSDATDITEDCQCIGRNYHQLVNKDDQTQWQLESTNIISNGDFPSNLDGWVIGLGLTISVIITNETSELANDGSATINVTGGTAPYQYSLDGITYQLSNVFSGLDSGSYTVYVLDDDGNQAFINFTIDTNITCGSYAGSDLYDIKGLQLSTLLNCELNDFT